MKLTDFTDFSLRVLIYLNRSKKLVTLNELSEELSVSRNHLMKITNKLINNDYIHAVRGRNGGLYISEEAGSSRVGDIVMIVEDGFGLVVSVLSTPSEQAVHFS